MKKEFASLQSAFERMRRVNIQPQIKKISSCYQRQPAFFVIIILGLGLVLLLLIAWNDDVSRFEEFKARIDPYKREIYYFIPAGFIFIALSAYLSKKGNQLLFPFATVVLLIVGFSLGATTFPKQNDHAWGVQHNGPSDIKEIAESSPQIRARETWLTYMKLQPHLKDKLVIVDESTNPTYLNGFTKAKVQVDTGHDSSFVPFSRMSALEIIFEGPLYKNRKLLLFGEGESYSFYSTAETDYVVANK